MIYFIAGLVGLACAPVGAYVSHVKGRPAIEGALLGFLLGPLGILVAALLPTIEPRAERGLGRDRVAWIPDDRDDSDELRVVSTDGMDHRVLAFLDKPKPVESIGKIDMDAIGRADHGPRE
jgi:hypothetical protein